MVTNACLLLFLLCLSDHNDQVGQRNNGSKAWSEYNLSVPDKIYNLPPVLLEISGLTTINASTVACVQDEYGIVFFYDLNEAEVKRTLVFGTGGDYEDIARAGGTLYVMRSDELLVEIRNYVSENFETASYMAKMPGSNAESLCYDTNNNRLLMMPREVSDNDKNNKNFRFVYAFDLRTKEISEDPVISFDIKKTGKFAMDHDINVPMKGKKGDRKPDIRMKTSAMAINPVNNRLYVLSGPERLLFVFDRDGKIIWLERLDKDLFPQPEGITFLVNGDMLISNEGRNKVPTLLLFSYN
jgi:hypothetical protein